MNDLVKGALEQAVVRWENIVAGGGKTISGFCPLCEIARDNACNGCPVKESTGKSECVGTPYWTWYHAAPGIDELNAAKEELKFLKQLLTEASGTAILPPIEKVGLMAKTDHNNAKNKNRKVSIRVTEDVLKQLKILAVNRGVTLQDMVEGALKKLLFAGKEHS